MIFYNEVCDIIGRNIHNVYIHRLVDFFCTSELVVVLLLVLLVVVWWTGGATSGGATSASKY